MNKNYMGETLGEIYRIFKLLNTKYFNDKLADPIFTIQGTRKRILGWCEVEKEWKPVNEENKEARREVTICSHHLKSDPLYIIETLQHELVHHYNLINDIRDCANNGYYHNKKFKTAAEKFGLICEEKTAKNGWGMTSPSEEFKKFIEEVAKPDKDKFEYFKPQIVKLAKVREKKSWKYKCPTCGLEAKSIKDVDIVCKSCNQQLIIEEGD
jgi:DNA-directed RNA polymerase subunit RPC12/RpoP